MDNGFIDYCFGVLLATASICILMVTIKLVFFGGFPC
jgi:hypothetical protein